MQAHGEELQLLDIKISSYMAKDAYVNNFLQHFGAI